MNMTQLTRRTISEPLGALLLAVLTAGSWAAWMAWDDEYTVDPVTQNSSGPYEPWQVIGCVLTLLAIGIGAALLLRPWTVIVTMTVAFTLAWSYTAASNDDSGLWFVGAVLVAGGMAAGSTVVTFVTQALARLRTT